MLLFGFRRVRASLLRCVFLATVTAVVLVAFHVSASGAEPVVFHKSDTAVASGAPAGSFGEGGAPYGTYSVGRGPADGGFPNLAGAVGSFLLAHGPASPVTASSLGPEVPSFRTQYSRTYVSAHGAYVARIYEQPINYLTASGSWAPINDALVASTAGDSVVNQANSYRVSLPDSLDAGAVTVSKGANAVSLSLLGAHGAGQTSGTTEVYADALSGVTAEYTARRSSVKEALVLKSRRSQSRFAYRLGLRHGLRPGRLANGAVVVRRGHRVVFTLAAPFMTDARDGAGVVGRVATRLRHTKRGWLLVEVPSRAWLDAKARTFPVTVDPTIYPNTAVDCTLQSSAPTTSFCDQSTDEIGAGTSTDHLALDFPVSSALPADSVVLNAQVELKLKSWANSTTVPISMYAMTQPFTSAATWNTSNGSTAWTNAGAATPGGAYDATKTYASVNVPATTGYYDWYPTDLVQNWVNGMIPNDGVILKEPSDNVANVMTFAGEADSGGNGPYLQVSYRPQTGDPRGATVEQTQLNDRMGLGVDVANGNVNLSADDLDITGTGLDLTLNRSYNSLLDDYVFSGQGWRGAIDEQLEKQPDGSIVYDAPDGQSFAFDYNPNPASTGWCPNQPTGSSWCTPPGIDAILLKSGSNYTISYRNGEVETFDSSGALQTIKDQNGNTITENYAGNGNPKSFTDTQGRVTTVTINSGNGFETQLTDSTGRLVKYGYNGSDEMTSYTDAAGHQTVYAYNGNQQMSQITDPDGEVTKLTYDSSGRIKTLARVTNNTTGAADTTSFAYNAPTTAIANTTALCPSGSYGQTVETDPRGNKTTYCYTTYDQVTAVFDAQGNEQQSTYDADSNVQNYNQAISGDDYTNVYDGSERLMQQSEPVSSNAPGQVAASNSYTYNPMGSGSQLYDPVSSQDAQGNTTSYGYGTNNNLTSITDGLSSQNEAMLQYNSNGTVQYSIDPDGNKTYYYHDSVGNLKQIVPPALSPGQPGTQLGDTTIVPDALSRTSSITDGKGQTTSYTYNAMDEVTNVAYADGKSVAYTYDPDGNVLTEIDRNGTTTYTYDLENHQTKKTTPDGRSTAYAYDGEGNLATLTDGGGTVTYTQNTVNQLGVLQEPGVSTAFGFGYNANGSRTSETLPNGVTVTNTYAPAGQLLTTKAVKGSTTLVNLAYTYTQGANDRDLVQTRTNNVNGQVTSYTYDALGRLHEAKTTSGSTVVDDRVYDYDGDGNLLSTVINGTTVNYTYNNDNELIGQASTTFTFDTNGNLTGSNNGLSISYNAQNQLASITSGGSTQAGSFLGEGNNDLVDEGTIAYQNNLLGAGSRTNSAGGYTYYTRDDQGDVLDARNPDGSRDYYLTDNQDSTVALTDANGNLVTNVSYDPWGAPTFSAAPTTEQNAAYSFLFDGGNYNASDGLYHFGARFYSPAAQRWTQQDPLNQIGSLTQDNRYTYASDNPVGQSDLSGDTTDTANCVAFPGESCTVDFIATKGDISAAFAYDEGPDGFPFVIRLSALNCTMLVCEGEFSGDPGFDGIALAIGLSSPGIVSIYNVRHSYGA